MSSFMIANVLMCVLLVFLFIYVFMVHDDEEILFRNFFNARKEESFPRPVIAGQISLAGDTALDVLIEKKEEPEVDSFLKKIPLYNYICEKFPDLSQTRDKVLKDIFGIWNTYHVLPFNVSELFEHAKGSYFEAIGEGVEVMKAKITNKFKLDNETLFKGYNCVEFTLIRHISFKNDDWDFDEADELHYNVIQVGIDTMIQVYRNGKWVNVKAGLVMKGDIIEFHDDELSVMTKSVEYSRLIYNPNMYEVEIQSENPSLRINGVSVRFAR